MSFEGVLLFTYVKDFTKSVCGSDFKRQFELNWQLIGVELGDPTASLCLMSDHMVLPHPLSWCSTRTLGALIQFTRTTENWLKKGRSWNVRLRSDSFFWFPHFNQLAEELRSKSSGGLEGCPWGLGAEERARTLHFGGGVKSPSCFHPWLDHILWERVIMPWKALRFSALWKLMDSARLRCLCLKLNVSV